VKFLALSIASCLLLSACDRVLRIRGVAPDACLLHLVDGDTGQIANTFPVSGSFEQRLMVGGLVAPNFTVNVECRGKLVKSIAHPEIRNGQVDLGEIGASPGP